ncbi:uncharacterized protein LOC114184860 [Vigna unguiculata]|uniref:uncharacterized protein LOC114184860 n=1 Tax=Vigna unguiculata TaxID=3917 RepID=UPI001016901B|nr:uncharacterized protein LOC114184860 [Vigna unguiculata]
MSSLRNLFKELSNNLYNFSTLLFALVAARNHDMFIKHHREMMVLLWTSVLYSFLMIVGSILQTHNTTLLPIITCSMFMVGGVASFLVLSFFSLVVAIITLVFWVVIFTLVVYTYVVPQRSS